MDAARNSEYLRVVLDNPLILSKIPEILKPDADVTSVITIRCGAADQMRIIKALSEVQAREAHLNRGREIIREYCNDRHPAEIREAAAKIATGEFAKYLGGEDG